MNGVLVEITKPVKLAEDAIVWNDLIIEPTSRLLSPETPLFRQFIDDGNGSRGVSLYHFDEVKEFETELYFSVQMPHNWAHTPIYPHVHWIPKVTSTKEECVVWGLEYTWSEIGEVFNRTDIILASECLPGGYLIKNKHYLSSFPPLSQQDGRNQLSSILVGRLFRNTKNIEDTYQSSAGLLYVDIHYQIDRLGSENELSD